MKTITFLLLLLVISATTITVTAQKKPKPPAAPPPTSTLHDADANAVPYSIRSDSQGAYVNGTDSVVLNIGSGFELDMLASPVRRAYVSFNDPVPNTNPNNLPPPPNGWYPTRFLSQCPALINTLRLNQTMSCNLIIAVDVGTTRYSIRFFAANFPGTDNITWTCTSEANNQCNGWRTQSDLLDNGGKLIAQLLKVTTVRNKTTTTNYGNYYQSFKISLTQP